MMFRFVFFFYSQGSSEEWLLDGCDDNAEPSADQTWRQSQWVNFILINLFMSASGSDDQTQLALFLRCSNKVEIIELVNYMINFGRNQQYRGNSKQKVRKKNQYPVLYTNYDTIQPCA
jgi:hypothetical protein